MPSSTALKTCTKCAEEKPVGEFPCDRQKHDGRHSQCKMCKRAYRDQRYALEPERFHASSRAHYRNNVERVRAQSRASKIRRLYAMTVDEYESFVAQPCAICGAEENIVVDHCHATGSVRGALCATCNTALGLFRDNPESMRRAAAYLEG